MDEDGCLLWTKGTNGRYGRVRAHLHSDLDEYVHRVAYELYYGTEPAHTVDHHCEKPLCFRFECLEDVTQLENNKRKPRAIVCPYGHPYIEGNLYRTKEGWRICRTCRLETMKRRYANKKTERLDT